VTKAEETAPEWHFLGSEITALIVIFPASATFSFVGDLHTITFGGSIAALQQVID
jgi:hypothetical protein